MSIASAPAFKGLPLAGSSRYTRVLPAVAALVYPGLIWCGPAIGPLFLLLSLAVPMLGVVIAHGTDHRLYPRSRWVAFSVVATPPLYSLLGGWLDFQRVLPFKGLHVWIAVWITAAALAFWERASSGPAERAQVAGPRGLTVAHGLAAALITVFTVAHLANHFAGWWGGERHTAIMQALRLVYRNPVVEIALLGCITFQVLSGLRLLKSKLPRAIDWLDSLQVASGLYLVLFFMSHLSAVLRARLLGGTDTNWQWLTADGLLTDPWSARLAPYYFLAVIAFGIHGAAGVRAVLLSHGRSVRLAARIFYGVVAAATLLSAWIIAALVRG